MNPLRQYRTAASWTQQEVGDLLEVDIQFISNMERNLAPIPAKHFRVLNRELKIPLKLLYAHNVERYRERLKREVERSK